VIGRNSSVQSSVQGLGVRWASSWGRRGCRMAGLGLFGEELLSGQIELIHAFVLKGKLLKNKIERTNEANKNKQC
jgi:hypothetical protein